MADVGQVLATGGTAIVGIAVGAGLTYFLGSLNRRHQEAREDKTRWYEARLQAYVELHRATGSGIAVGLSRDPSEEAYEELTLRLASALGVVRLVGSPEVITAAGRLVHTMLRQAAAYARQFADRMTEEADRLTQENSQPLDAGHIRVDVDRIQELLHEFTIVARRDLGHPVPPRGKHATRP